MGVTVSAATLALNPRLEPLHDVTIQSNRNANLIPRRGHDRTAARFTEIKFIVHTV
jgi:hypothetical protein